MSKKKIKASDFELKEEIVHINRVSKVVKGGRNFGFSSIVVVGDRNGTIGYGTGKAKDVQKSVAKAIENARKRLIKINLRGDTIWHPADGKYGAGHVFLRPASSGTGVVAGGATRIIAQAAGIKNLLAKSKRSSNPHNLVKATFDALQQQNS
ncbi:MAG: 30S ribosomal protein S5, partial [Bacteroidota bacterium]